MSSAPTFLPYHRVADSHPVQCAGRVRKYYRLTTSTSLTYTWANSFTILFYNNSSMKMKITQVILTSTILYNVFLRSKGADFIRMCYFTNWSNFRNSTYATFNIKDIDASLCTHLVYAFARVDQESRRIVPTALDDTERPWTSGRYREFNDLKHRYPHLKTLLSIGGEYARTEDFRAIENDLDWFAKTTIEYLHQYGFDGLDIDWEYPDDPKFFTQILKTLREAFDDDHSRLMLTAALAAGRQNIDVAYSIPELNRYLDYASIMTYDYHGPWTNFTSFNSPLYSRRNNNQFNQELSTNWTINYYISKGLAAKKILVGVTPVGRRFVLEDESDTSVGVPAYNDPNWISDLYLQSGGRVTYPEMCRLLQNLKVQQEFDDVQSQPYAYLGPEWYGYEDVKSLKIKVQWMLEKGVGGAMFWSLDFDDFSGIFCQAGKYPMLNVLNMQGGKPADEPLTPNVRPGIRYLYKRNAAAGCLHVSSMTSALHVVTVLLWAGLLARQ